MASSAEDEAFPINITTNTMAIILREIGTSRVHVATAEDMLADATMNRGADERTVEVTGTDHRETEMEMMVGLEEEAATKRTTHQSNSKGGE